ncbi:lipase [Streptomyces kaniharaensis]|uniref:Lipase n=1 Tax=Streptomyces kaniharaensis TaxID=212423 RepID=A0A6N7KZY5_9ACTN|nr:SGNH/GDSL hydrolase family protein [Streptomyces kaniharaensis]MQS16405.1 lipase [Streptomyces kaniharaensis]
MHDHALFTTPVEPFLRGALDVEHTEHGVLPRRLPGWVRRQFPDDFLAMMAAQPSGVRLSFRTRARTVELAVQRTRTSFAGFPPCPEGHYDLVVDGRLAGRAAASGGHLRVVDPVTGASDLQAGPPGTVRFADLPAGVKDVELWLPYQEVTELIALRTDAPVEAAPQRGRRVWVHHGSSISHGSDADGPTGIWPVLAATAGRVDLVNLAFGGNALLDPFLARVIRDIPADLISVKLGINLVNTDLMRLRAFTPAVHGFLDTIRDGHPEVPLLVVSSVLCPIHEDTPGPLVTDFGDGRPRFRAGGDPAEVVVGRLTLGVIRTELARITERRSACDPNLHYLDGRELYGPADYAEFPLPDEVHPDQSGHRRIGERFATLAFGPGGPFAPPGDRR